MWVDSRECVPFKDGEYLIQTIYGDVRSMLYTFEGGWNTNRNALTGEVMTENRIENDGYIARWFLPPTPPAIPEEWVDKYRKENE